MKEGLDRQANKIKITLNPSTLILENGDITKTNPQTIANVANSDLIFGARVARVIHKKGGPDIQKECDQVGHCSLGNVVTTTA